jgi:hypothetical protein
MIETKIKCDSSEYHYGRGEDLKLSEAIEAGWWEIEILPGSIEVRPGSIMIRQPKTIEAFNENAMHACSASHARALVKQAALELIPDKVEEVKSNA